MSDINAVAVQSTGVEAGQGVSQDAATVSPAVEPANVFGFAPADDGQAAGGNVFGFAPEGQPAAPEGGEKEQAPAEPASGKEQNAFAAQRRRYEARIKELESSPQHQIGDRMVRDIMRQNGCTEAEAITEINSRLVKAFADRENIGEDAARMLMDLDANRAPVQGTPEAQAKRIVDDLMSVNLPEGFDLDAAMGDEAFQKLLPEYGAAAAVRIYQAEQRASMAPQQVADMLRARQSVPAPTRPTQSVNAEPNYTQMSSEDFWKVKERYKKNLNL